MKSVIAIVLASYALDALAICPSFFDSSQYEEPNEKYLFGGGPANGLASVANSFFSVNAGTDKTNAIARYSIATSGAADLPPEGNLGWIPGCNHSLSIALSSPIDKSDNVTDLATLDGLANAFTLKIEYAQYRDRIRRLGQGRAADGVESKHSFFWGLSATLGRESFEYIDFDSFKKQKDDEKPWSASLFYGKQIGSWTVTAKVELEEAYKDQEDVVRCRPTEDSLDLQCLSGPPGEAIEKDSQQLSVEVRRVIGGRFGIAPYVHRDFESSVTGVNVPVFLWQSSSKQLTGGVRAGWRSDTDDLEFGVFITQPF